MSDIYQRIYQSKKMTAAEAMGLVENGDFISVPTGVGEPPTLLSALSEQRQRFHGVTVAQILPLRKFAYMDPRRLTTSAISPSSTAVRLAPAGWKDGSIICQAISPKCRR